LFFSVATAQSRLIYSLLPQEQGLVFQSTAQATSLCSFSMFSRSQGKIITRFSANFFGFS
jgi:hypothetical protein